MNRVEKFYISTRKAIVALLICLILCRDILSPVNIVTVAGKHLSFDHAFVQY